MRFFFFFFYLKSGLMEISCFNALAADNQLQTELRYFPSLTGCRVKITNLSVRPPRARVNTPLTAKCNQRGPLRSELGIHVPPQQPVNSPTSTSTQPMLINRVNMQ